MTDENSWDWDAPERPREEVDDGESDSIEKEGQSPLEEEKSIGEALTGSERQGAYQTAKEAAKGTVENVFRRGEYMFLPVFGFNESNMAARKYGVAYGLEDDDTVMDVDPSEPLDVDGKEFTWWEDNSLVPKHPFLLVNPLEIASVDPDIHNFRHVFRLQKGEHFVFSDSGGYQLVTLDEADIVESADEHSFNDYQVHPETLLKWQTKNADAGSTIDFPPYISTGGDSYFDSIDSYDQIIETAHGPMPWYEFFQVRADEAADMTYRMGKRLKELRDEGDEDALDYIYAPVIQGRPHPYDTHELVREWHTRMENACEMADIEPRGWVCSPKPPRDFGQLALFLGYAAEHLQDSDFLHILMVGGLLQKSLLMYYAKQVDQMVTSDASSYAAGGKRRQLDLPKTATRRAVIISSRDDGDDNAAQDPNKLDRYPCRCAVCSTIEREYGFEFITDGEGSARSSALNLHNLQQTLNIERTLDALLREKDATIVETGGEPTGCEFWRYLRTMARDKAVEDLYRSMDYVRIALEDGLEEANSTYRIRWEKSGGKSIDRGSGSGADASW